MNWKTNYLLLFLALPLFSFAQPSSTLDFVFGSSYTILHKLRFDSPFNSSFENLGRMNFRLGVNYNRRLSQKLWFKTGFRLVREGYKTPTVTDLRWGSENQGGVWVPDPTLPRSIQFYEDFVFFELPLALRYEWGEKKLSPFIEGGISPYIFATLIQTQKTNLGSETSVSRSQIQGRNIVLVSNLSFGFNYRLTEKWQFFAQSIVRYHLNKISKAEGVKVTNINVGLELGSRMAL